VASPLACDGAGAIARALTLVKTGPHVPYASTEDLPVSIRAHLPEHAQEIYLSAFNHAWIEYRDREPERLEEIAHRIAWSAVKQKYQKTGAEWIPRDPDG
jgi:cation transport regulator